MRIENVDTKIIQGIFKHLVRHSQMVFNYTVLLSRPTPSISNLTMDVTGIVLPVSERHVEDDLIRYA